MKNRICFMLCVASLLMWSASVAALEMKAGVAKGAITPEPGKNRISVMGEPLKGVDHDIYARVLTLNDGAHRLAIVTYDLNCLDVATPILRKRCKEELGIEPAYLVPLATHNHAAPIQIVPDNFDYGRWLADRIFGLIQEAIANEQGPAQVQFGWGNGYFLTCMGAAPIDYEVQVLKVSRDSKPVAVYFNQPTHPLHVKGFANVDVAHPGYAVDEVEARLPGAQVMYSDAAGGNQFTLKGMEASADEVKALGKQLAEVVLKTIEAPMQEVTGPITSMLETISLPLAPPIPLKKAKELARKIPKDIGRVPYPHPDRETNWIRVLLDYYKHHKTFPTQTTDLVCTDDAFLVEKLDAPRDFPCHYEETIVAEIGPLVFVAMQGEVCTPIGMRIKDAYRCKMPIMVSAYMGEHNLYIPTRELIRENAYQAKVIQIQYACPVGWDPSVENVMVDAVKRMIRKIAE